MRLRDMLLMITLLMTLTACGGGGDDPTPEPTVPTLIPTSTNTLPPSETPLPTETFTPAPTIAPRATLPPTFTPLPAGPEVETAVPINPNVETNPDQMVVITNLEQDFRRTVRLTNARGTVNTALADGFNAAWSPDGTRIVYQIDLEQDTTPVTIKQEAVIILLEQDRVDIPFQDDPGDVIQPLFTADGLGLLYTRDADNDGLTELYVDLFDPAPPLRIGSVPVSEDGGYAWSPDGGRIAFVGTATEEIPSALYTINGDGSGQTAIAEGGTFSGPTWSPDGTRIAYECGADICTINADGSGAVILAQNAAQPDWSADGTQIVYSCGDVCTIPSTGGEPQLITTELSATIPTFSNDDDQIAFVHEGIGTWTLFVFNYRDNSLNEVMVSPTVIEDVSWRPPEMEEVE